MECICVKGQFDLDIEEWIVGTWALYISMHGLASQHLWSQAYGASRFGQCAVDVNDSSESC